MLGESFDACFMVILFINYKWSFAGYGGPSSGSKPQNTKGTGAVSPSEGAVTLQITTILHYAAYHSYDACNIQTEPPSGRK